MRSFSLDAFDGVPSAKEAVSGRVNVADLPAIELVRAEARWTADMTDLFDKPRDQIEDRSSAMQRMAFSGAEMGWADEQIAAVLYAMDEKLGKYTVRPTATRDNILLNMVNRAREKVGYVKADDFALDLSKFRQDPSIKVVTEDEKPPLIYGFQEFVDAEFRIDWMFEGLLAQGGIGLVTAEPGVGKTQLAIQLAAYLALGHENFLRWENKVGKRKVLFLSLEMSPPPLNLFMRTIGQSYDDKEALNRNFKVMPWGKPLALDTEKGQAFLDTVLDEHMPDLLVIDSLQRSISKEMTDELAAKNLMHYLAMLRDKYKCAVVMIHHNRKRSAEAKKTDIAQLSDVYGSVFFSADVDFVLALNKQESGLLRLHTLKNRLGPELPPFEIARDDTLHFSSEVEALTANIPHRGESEERGSRLDV